MHNVKIFKPGDIVVFISEDKKDITYVKVNSMADDNYLFNGDIVKSTVHTIGSNGKGFFRHKFYLLSDVRDFSIDKILN